MTAEELLKRYAAGERYFSMVDFSGVDLTGADLKNTNFSGSNFTSTNLKNTNFSGSNFTCAILENTNFSGANLSKVIFERNDTIKNCDFSGANLQGACLAEAVIFDSDLRGANLDEFVMIEGSIQGCNMEGASLRNADLGVGNGSSIHITNLRHADLRGCVGQISMDSVDLTGAIGFKPSLPGEGYWNLTLPDGRFIADWNTEEI